MNFDNEFQRLLIILRNHETEATAEHVQWLYDCGLSSAESEKVITELASYRYIADFHEVLSANPQLIEACMEFRPYFGATLLKAGSFTTDEVFDYIRSHNKPELATRLLPGASLLSYFFRWSHDYEDNSDGLNSLCNATGPSASFFKHLLFQGKPISASRLFCDGEHFCMQQLVDEDPDLQSVAETQHALEIEKNRLSKPFLQYNARHLHSAEDLLRDLIQRIQPDTHASHVLKRVIAYTEFQEHFLHLLTEHLIKYPKTPNAKLIATAILHASEFVRKPISSSQVLSLYDNGLCDLNLTLPHINLRSQLFADLIQTNTLTDSDFQLLFDRIFDQTPALAISQFLTLYFVDPNITTRLDRLYSETRSIFRHFDLSFREHKITSQDRLDFYLQHLASFKDLNPSYFENEFYEDVDANFDVFLPLEIFLKPFLQSQIPVECLTSGNSFYIEDDRTAAYEVARRLHHDFSDDYVEHEILQALAEPYMVQSILALQSDDEDFFDYSQKGYELLKTKMEATLSGDCKAMRTTSTVLL